MRLLVNMQISKLVAAGRDLWSKATGDWSAEDYLDKLKLINGMDMDNNLQGGRGLLLMWD